MIDSDQATSLKNGDTIRIHVYSDCLDIGVFVKCDQKISVLENLVKDHEQSVFFVSNGEILDRNMNFMWYSIHNGQRIYVIPRKSRRKISERSLCGIRLEQARLNDMMIDRALMRCSIKKQINHLKSLEARNLVIDDDVLLKAPTRCNIMSTPLPKFWE